jgi:OmpA-OmpF porin, OOP family
MTLHVRCLAVLALALLMAACQRQAAVADADPKIAPAATTPAASPEEGTEATGNDTPGATTASKAFDITRLPVSDAALGEFPYFSLPDGYVPMDRPVRMDYTRFPFWTGHDFEWVEGRSYESAIDTEGDKTFSEFELRRNIEAMLTQVGAIRLTTSRIPADQLDALGEDITQGHIAGLGDIYNDAAEVFVLRRADRTIWIHFTSNSASGAWMILETKPFVESAHLLNAAGSRPTHRATPPSR